MNGFLGGSLAHDEALVQQLFVTLDVVIADLGRLALKMQSPMPLPDQAFASELPRLTKEMDDLAEFNRRWKQILQQYLDCVAFLFVSILISERRSWRIAWHIETAEESIKAAEHLHSTRALELTFQLADDCNERSDVPDFWKILLFPEKRPDGQWPLVCFAVIEAHPAAIGAAADRFMTVHSGLFALSRSYELVPYTKIHLEDYPPPHSDVRMPDSVRVRGWALANERRNEPMLIFSNAAGYLDNCSVSSDLVMLPRDEHEVEAAQQLLGDLPLMGFALFSTMPLGRDIARLRKAIWFWAQGELMQQRLSRGGLTPHAIAATFMHYCSVLEVLLGGKSAVSETVAGRAAAVVCGDASERLNKWREVKDLYDLRSRYVHEGDCQIRRADLHAMRSVTRNCLRYALRWLHKMSEQQLVLNHELYEELVLQIPTWGQNELELVKTIGKFFPDEAFGKHCDLLRFGASSV